MTLFDGINKLCYFAQGRGSIGIHEEHVTTFRVEHAKANGIAFSHCGHPRVRIGRLSPQTDGQAQALIFAAISETITSEFSSCPEHQRMGLSMCGEAAAPVHYLQE